MKWSPRIAICLVLALASPTMADNNDINCPSKMTVRRVRMSETLIKGSFRGSEFTCNARYSEEPCGPFTTTSQSDNIQSPSLAIRASSGDMIRFHNDSETNARVVRNYCNADSAGADCWKVWSADHLLKNDYTTDIARITIEYKQNIECNSVAF